METKTSKILSIIAAGVIFIAFFMPWTKSMFGSGVSAWDIVKLLFEALSYAKELSGDIRIYLPFVLIALPICSAIIIINNASTLNESNDTTKSSKVVTIIVVVLVIVALIYAQSEDSFSDFSDIFNLLGIGFYLTLIGAGYYLVDLLTEKTKTLQTYKASSQTEIFCTNCGKKYIENAAGQFCEECGNKL